MRLLSVQEKAKLLEIALDAAQKAYAPYSSFRVGAAVLTEQGNYFAGCNVENRSYGLTICAERSAIAAAVTAEGKQMQLRAIAIVNDRQAACSPCGACRQVISEFGADALVIFQGSHQCLEKTAQELLPEAFIF